MPGFGLVALLAPTTASGETPGLLSPSAAPNNGENTGGFAALLEGQKGNGAHAPSLLATKLTTSGEGSMERHSNEGMPLEGMLQLKTLKPVEADSVEIIQAVAMVVAVLLPPQPAQTPAPTAEPLDGQMLPQTLDESLEIGASATLPADQNIERLPPATASANLSAALPSATSQPVTESSQGNEIKTVLSARTPAAEPELTVTPAAPLSAKPSEPIDLTAAITATAPLQTPAPEQTSAPAETQIYDIHDMLAMLGKASSQNSKASEVQTDDDRMVEASSTPATTAKETPDVLPSTAALTADAILALLRHTQQSMAAEGPIAETEKATATLAAAPIPTLTSLLATRLVPEKTSANKEQETDARSTTKASPEVADKLATLASHTASDLFLGAAYGPEKSKKASEPVSATKTDDVGLLVTPASNETNHKPAEIAPAKPSATVDERLGGAALATKEPPVGEQTDAPAKPADGFAALLESQSKEGKIDPAFIKLSKPSDTTTHTPFTDQIFVSIRAAAHAQNNKVRIQLTPHDLGAVDVTLTFRGEHITHVTVTAEKPETLHMLRQDSHLLEQSLQDGGLKANAGNMQFNLKGEQNQAAFSDGQGQGARRSPTPDGKGDGLATEEPLPAPAEILQPLTASIGVNIHV